MHLYNLTLSRASGIQCAVYGNFSGAKAQELVVSRGKVLELLRPNDAGKLMTIVSTEVFGCIRSLAVFRMIGAQTDYVIVGSDSGRVVILKFNKEKNSFQKVHQETYGRSGCRRIVPGQMLACDPKGRACMVAAVEKQKFVYVLNRDNAANLTISSPLEAHKSHTIVFSIVGLDVEFDNPVFAAIELDYGDVDQDPTGEAATEVQKHLTFYELDLGVNNVIRKWTDPVDNGANLLIAVPGGSYGPGGVLVCSENFIIYKNQDHEDVRAVIPRRSDLLADRGVLIVSYGTLSRKAYTFFLIQSEYGDLYKVTLGYSNDKVTEVKVKYFDTIPVCTSICVLKTGFLFAASEAGNHALYLFIGTGDDEDSVESSSLTLQETEDGYQPVFFEPRPLRNLQLVQETSSLMPITDMKVVNLVKEEIPQIYVTCGRGPRSTLAVLRPGLAVNELAVSPLPGTPGAVWTIKRAVDDEYDQYIIVSFTNATLVFSIGEEIKETNDSGFLGTVATIHTQLLSDNSMLQVHSGGLRHIRTDRRINEWKVPGRRQIQRAASNEKQVAIALSGGEVIYFELDTMGQLLEERKREMDEDVMCMDLAPLQEGLSRSRFLVVGCADSAIRVLGLDPEDGLRNLAIQAVPSTPFSALFLYSANVEDNGPVGGSSEAGGLFLHVGLESGVMTRTEVDRVTGQLSDTRSRFLGTKPPRLVPTVIRGMRSLLALSSRAWLGYSDQGRFNISPLSYEALSYASAFASDQCPEGFVSLVNKPQGASMQGSLRILSVDNVGEAFNQQVTRLRYTPRKMEVHPLHNTLFVAEADHAAIPLAQRADLQQRAVEAGKTVVGTEFDEEAAVLEEQYGPPRAEPGQWASCLRIIEPVGLATTFVSELDNNEAVTSMAIVNFAPAAQIAAGAFAQEPVLVVGTARGLKYLPTDCDAAYIRTYRILDGGKRLDLLHKTQLEVAAVPGALVAFKGRLLAGVGNVLRIYELGKKKLLRKCEYKKLPHHIMSLSVQGGRIYVGDAQESVHLMKYKKNDNQLYCFADEATPRYLTSVLPIDFDTMAGADKFGNLFVARLPAEVSAQVEDDPSGGKLSGSANGLNGAPNKLSTVANFHVGDTITALQRASLQPGGQEAILYATVMGGIGALLPFTSREEVDFFVHLEMHLRQDNQPLCGRDHMAFRSAYFPVKDVVDGDLCSQYPTLPVAKQRSISEELERTPGEVLKKLEDIRNRIL